MVSFFRLLVLFKILRWRWAFIRLGDRAMGHTVCKGPVVGSKSLLLRALAAKIRGRSTQELLHVK